MKNKVFLIVILAAVVSLLTFAVNAEAPKKGNQIADVSVWNNCPNTNTGTWKVDGNKFSFDNAKDWGFAFMNNNLEASDFIMTFTVNSWTDGGPIFRRSTTVDGKMNCYMVGTDLANIYIAKRSADNFTLLSQPENAVEGGAPFAKAYDMSQGKTWTIVMQGNVISVYLDGSTEPYIQAKDSSFTSGTFGFQWKKGEIQNFAVYEISSGNPSGNTGKTGVPKKGEILADNTAWENCPNTKTGNWTVNGNKFSFDGENVGFAFLNSGLKVTDFIMTFKIDRWVDGGPIFRRSTTADGKMNCYMVGTDLKNIYIGKRTADTFTLLNQPENAVEGGAPFAKPYDMSQGKTWTIVMQGDTISVYLDGSDVPYIQAKDSSFTEGDVGFQWKKGQISNFKIYAIDNNSGTGDLTGAAVVCVAALIPAAFCIRKRKNNI